MHDHVLFSVSPRDSDSGLMFVYCWRKLGHGSEYVQAQRLTTKKTSMPGRDWKTWLAQK